MRDTRKRSDKCEGSNLNNTKNEMDILTGNTYCTRTADKSHTELSSVTKISPLGESLKTANDTDSSKMYNQNEKTNKNIVIQLTCDNYATSLLLHPTISLSSENEQVCRLCKNCTEQNTLTRIPKTSSTDITESTTNESRYRRTLHFKHKLPDWVKATALLFILFLSSCNALPAHRGTRRKSAATPATDFDIHEAPELSNGTGLSRNGRSSDFTQHKGPQRLYNNFYGVYLEVKRNGKVTGTRTESPYTDIKFKSLSRGRVALYFIKSGRYLAINKKRLSSEAVHTDECCTFKESYYGIEKLHFIYESPSPKSKRGRKRHRYIAIKVKKRRSKKCKATTLTKVHKFAMFQKVASS